MQTSEQISVDAKPLNIYQRVNKVREAVAYVQKDREVSTGGSGKYKAVSHDMVTALVRPHLITYGILVVPTLVETKTENTGSQTSGGTPILRVEAIYSVAFVSIDYPDDRIVLTVSAHGNDTGDKGPGKCFSYAVKYALMKLLSLETGEDEEGRTERGAMDPKREADFVIEMNEAETPADLTAAWQRATKAAQELGDKKAEARFTNHASKAKAKMRARSVQ